MIIGIAAALTVLSASSARADAPAQSAAAQQVTEARLALVQSELPLALALPADVPQTPDQQRLRAQDAQCPQPYASYRGRLDDFAAKVVNPMHSRNDVAEAKKEFDSAYVCAARIAHEADPSEFQMVMARKLAVAQAQLARLGASERRALVERLIVSRNLEQDRLARQRADKTVAAAVDIMRRLEKGNLGSEELGDLSGAVKPGSSAKRFADDWLRNPVYASEFRPPVPPTYRNLDEKAVPAAPTGTSAPVQTSALASFISHVGEFSRKYYQKAEVYVRQVSAAIINSSAARAIDARLAAAVVWAESNFHTAARSFAECVGLGQLSETVARAYGVRDRNDIDQNLKGTTGYLRDLMKQFSTLQDQKDLQALFGANAALVKQEVATGKSKQKAINETFSALWPRIPYGMKNAVAAYNAGAPTIARYGGWDRLPLPRRGCAHRPANDTSYCQTTAYVPRVLKNYFTVYVETSDQDPGVFSAEQRPDRSFDPEALEANYRPISGSQTGL